MGRAEDLNGTRHSQKIAADTFEAYIGVLWKDIMDTELSDLDRQVDGSALEAFPKLFKLHAYFEALVSTAVFPTLNIELDTGSEDISCAIERLRVGDTVRS
jgi:hypothetical protein